MSYQASSVVGAVGIPGQGWSPEFLQQLLHSSGEVNVDTADHGSAVNKG